MRYECIPEGGYPAAPDLGHQEFPSARPYNSGKTHHRTFCFSNAFGPPSAAEFALVQPVARRGSPGVQADPEPSENVDDLIRGIPKRARARAADVEQVRRRD